MAKRGKKAKRPPRSRAVLCQLAYVDDGDGEVPVVHLHAENTYLTSDVALRLAQRIIGVAGIADAIERIDRGMGKGKADG